MALVGVHDRVGAVCGALTHTYTRPYTLYYESVHVYRAPPPPPPPPPAKMHSAVAPDGSQPDRLLPLFLRLLPFFLPAISRVKVITG